MRALSHPESRVALAGVPIDVMKAAPYDGLASRDLDAKQVELFAEKKARHLTSGYGLLLLGREVLQPFRPEHPAVKVVPGFGNGGYVADAVSRLFRPDQ